MFDFQARVFFSLLQYVCERTKEEKKGMNDTFRWNMTGVKRKKKRKEARERQSACKKSKNGEYCEIVVFFYFFLVLSLHINVVYYIVALSHWRFYVVFFLHYNKHIWMINHMNLILTSLLLVFTFTKVYGDLPQGSGSIPNELLILNLIFILFFVMFSIGIQYRMFKWLDKNV